MDKNEIFALEYSIKFFNKLCKTSNTIEDFKPFDIVWDTSLGLAKFKAIHFSGKISDPVLFESPGYYEVSTTFSTFNSSSDLFGLVQKQIIKNFSSDGFINKNLYLRNRPDILLNELSKISQVEVSEDLKTPNYSSVFDFELLDGSIKLPFISLNSFTVNGPVSLVSEN
ncbi:hypothetical protein ITR00_06330 [Pediococcus pentosaceus]|uniref:hypothetical protein n=1 Tax=Pediococcus pentosaceus TaxID=1255 RepID=UPI00190D6D21|nr:hypothetical protein [Pediococcus pentosaceus]MBF7125676.1 hypothetical protein [Pediococcus pentosaceus]WPK17271.1 hypothetical protein R6U75_03785 [Pediococcus pentosaceus]